MPPRRDPRRHDTCGDDCRPRPINTPGRTSVSGLQDHDASACFRGLFARTLIVRTRSVILSDVRHTEPKGVVGLHSL